MGQPVVHFEIGCSDQGKTAEFFKNLFGWQMQPMGPASMIIPPASSGLPSTDSPKRSGAVRTFVSTAGMAGNPARTNHIRRRRSSCPGFSGSRARRLTQRAAMTAGGIQEPLRIASVGQ